MLDEHGRPRLDTGLYAEICRGRRGGGRRQRGWRRTRRTRREAGPRGGPFATAGRRARDAAARHPRRPCRGRSRPGARSRHLPDDRSRSGLFEREERLVAGRHAARPTRSSTSRPPRRRRRSPGPRRPRRSTAAGPRARRRAERFDAFRALPDEARAAWLGHAVARTLEASLNLAGPRACGFHDHLGQLLGIDVARWWRPTGANYFDRVPKSVTLAALAEVGGPALAGRYARRQEGRACPGLRTDLLGRLHRRGRGQGGRSGLGARCDAVRAAGRGRDRGATTPRPPRMTTGTLRQGEMPSLSSSRLKKRPDVSRALLHGRSPSPGAARFAPRHRLGAANGTQVREPDLVKTGQRDCPKGHAGNPLLTAAINADQRA